MSRARILSTLVVGTALVVGGAAPLARADDGGRTSPAAKAADLIDEGDAFIDAIGDGARDRYVHAPGKIGQRTVIVTESSSDPQVWRGYDFDPDGSTLYAVYDDGFFQELVVVDQEVGRGGDPVGDTLELHATNDHHVSDITIDPVDGDGYVASISGTGPDESTVYTVDLETGALTELATTGGYELVDMSMNCKGQLYAVDTLGDRLVKVDPKTGGLTPVGPIGIPLRYSQGIDFDNQTGLLHAWLYDEVAKKTKYSKLDLKTGKPTLFAGGTIDGEYEGAIKTECPSPKCPQLVKKVKSAKKSVATAQKNLAKAKKTGKPAKIDKAKKKLATAKKKLKKAQKAAEAGNC